MDHARRAELTLSGGLPPQMATVNEMLPPELDISPAQISHGPGGRAARNGKLNLRAVADVLETYGLDPIEEIAKVMVATEPVKVDGQVVLNPDGTPRMKPVLDTQTFLKAAMELANYSRPKLKAVEVTNKTPELTDEQIDRRLEALITRVGKTR